MAIRTRCPIQVSRLFSHIGRPVPLREIAHRCRQAFALLAFGVLFGASISLTFPPAVVIYEPLLTEDEGGLVGSPYTSPASDTAV